MYYGLTDIKNVICIQDYGMPYEMARLRVTYVSLGPWIDLCIISAME